MGLINNFKCIQQHNTIMVSNLILYRLWDILIIASATLAAIKIPVQFVIEPPVWLDLIHFDRAILGIFAADIFLNFFRPLLLKGQLVRNKRSLAKHYLAGWFAVDLAAVVPFDLLMGLPFLRLMRLVKLARVAQMFHRRRRKQPCDR